MPSLTPGSKARLGAALSSASLLALATGLTLAGPAWADGGNGQTLAGGNPGGLGGADGSLASATGKDGSPGATSSLAGAGGGGALDLTTGNGAPGGAQGVYGGASPGAAPTAPGAPALTVSAPTIITTATTGAVGVGATTGTGALAGTGGGGGGVAVSATADVTVAATAVVTGGRGGGSNPSGAGGGAAGLFSSADVTVEAGAKVTGGLGGTGRGGGEGGAAVVINGGVLTNSGALTGGAGGLGLGGGGDGGAGAVVLPGATVINNAGGVIQGGVGGRGSVSTGTTPTSPGIGGAGVEGSGLTVIDAGTITGGAGGAGTGWTPVTGKAVQFTGGVNTLELWSTWTINGTVQAFSTADTVKLGGATDASFDLSKIGPGAQFQGFGQFAKVGASAWTLTGTTTAVTPWTLAGGVLKIASDGALGDASGALTLNGGALETTTDIAMTRAVVMAGAGTIDTDAGTTLTLGGPVSGVGGLTKAGDGTLVLTGADTVSGVTTIAAGALQLGNGGTTGAIAGNVADNGVLAFDRSDAVTFSGAISGTGAVSQTGAGTTTLSGANTYSGGTTISAGTLAGQATSFGSGAIHDGAALIADEPTDAFLANAIDGAGTFTKTGPGQLTYTGTATLTGPTTVAAGAMSVNGSLTSSTFTVMSGATLKGKGAVGATTIQSGGTVAPGNSIGVLHVNGTFVQQAGSTYQVEVDPTSSNASDQIAVTGSAALQPGAGLTVVKTVPGNYHMGAVYTVLSATGGVSGTYALGGDLQPVSAFLSLKDSYDANHAYLTVAQTSSPSDVATTPNQQQVAGGLPNSGGPTDPLLNAPTESDAQKLLDALAGDGHAAARGVLVSDSRLVRDLAIARVQTLFCSPVGLVGGRPDGACPEDAQPAAWGQVFGAWGRTDGDGNAGEANRSVGGFLLGADAPVIAGWRAGGFAGYSRTQMYMDGGTAFAGIDSYHLGVYGGTQYGALGIRLGGSYTFHRIDTDRTVDLPGLRQQLEASYDADTAQGFAQAGYRLSLGKMSVEPFAEAAYASVHSQGFTEHGGVAALTGRASDDDAVYSTLGFKPALPLAFGEVQASLHGMFGWRHDYGDVSPISTVRFVAGGSPFSVEGAPLAKDAGVAVVGLDMRNDNAVFGLTYGAQGWTHDFGQTVRANFRIAFGCGG